MTDSTIVATFQAQHHYANLGMYRNDYYESLCLAACHMIRVVADLALLYAFMHFTMVLLMCLCKYMKNVNTAKCCNHSKSSAKQVNYLHVSTNLVNKGHFSSNMKLKSLFVCSAAAKQCNQVHITVTRFIYKLCLDATTTT